MKCSLNYCHSIPKPTVPWLTCFMCSSTLDLYEWVITSFRMHWPANELNQGNSWNMQFRSHENQDRETGLGTASNVRNSRGDKFLFYKSAIFLDDSNTLYLHISYVWTGVPAFTFICRPTIADCGLVLVEMNQRSFITLKLLLHLGFVKADFYYVGGQQRAVEVKYLCIFISSSHSCMFKVTAITVTCHKLSPLAAALIDAECSS